MLGDVSSALDLVCQASTALASSIRQIAGWLGQASAQSATPAKLQQVSEYFSLTCHLKPQHFNACVTPEASRVTLEAIL